MSRRRENGYRYGRSYQQGPNNLALVAIFVCLVALIFRLGFVELTPQGQKALSELTVGARTTEDIRTIPLSEEASSALARPPGRVLGGRDASSQRLFPVPGRSYDTARITSGYGKRWGEFHYGVDIGAEHPGAQPLIATEDAVVTEIWHQTDKGGIVVEYVPTSNKQMTIKYLHLRQQHVWGNKVVPEGAIYSELPNWPPGGIPIRAGEHIADMGDTGYSFGEHLHIGIKVGNQWANPTEYLKSLKASQ